MLIGILAGLATGALWGISFVAPRMVAPFSAFDLSVGRYLVFGLVSLALMADARFRPTGLSRQQIVTGLALGAVGYFGYFLAASYAVLLAGAVLPPLITGTAPVLLAIVGNLREPAVRWRRLVVPLGLIIAGLVVVNAASLGEAAPEEAASLLAGIALSVAALLVWLGYGLANAMVMRGADAPRALPWTGLQGLGAGGVAMLMLPLVLSVTAPAADGAATLNFLAWVLAMGMVVSWIGTYGWVVASARLPLVLSAQLIVAETVFGLGYGLAYEERWPTTAETLGTLLQLIGVVAAVAMFARRRAPAPGLTPARGIPESCGSESGTAARSA